MSFGNSGIKAHLTICFMALTMMRIIQRKTREAQGGDKPGFERNWTYGIPGARISKALAGWQVIAQPNEYYQMMNSRTEDLSAILKAFGMELKQKLYSRGDIRELKASANPF